MTLHDDALNQPSGNSAQGSPISSLWWLAVATVLLYLAGGNHPIALAAWLAPVCLVRFVRMQPALRGIAVAYVVLAVTNGIVMRDMVPVPGVGYYIFVVISGVSAVLPNVVDRLLAPRLKGFAGTLVFPATLVAIQFANSFGPYGSWGTLAYTQSGNLPLLQSLAVTGLWGIVFLIGWFAGIVNYALQEGLRTRPAMRALAVFGGVFLLVVAAGEAWLALAPPSAPTVRVASLSPVKFPVGLDKVIGGKMEQADIVQFEAAATAAQNDLLERSAREAEAGAKIVFWSETALHILKQDEQSTLQRGSAFAANHRIYLGMALAVWTPGLDRPLENKIVLIEPTGKIAWQFAKARPVPGPEASWSSTSDGQLRMIDTPYGRITGVICFDADFPPLIAQAGRMGADIILIPSNDWRGIDPTHTKMASARAIEQGVNLVRQVSNGYSAAYDYQGRPLAAMDAYQAANLAMVAQVPTRGVHTLYTRLGDWLAWLNIAGLIVLTLLALFRRKSAST